MIFYKSFYDHKIAYFTIIGIFINITESAVDCNDNNSCKLIKSEIFEMYCEKSTLKTICPIKCNITNCIDTLENDNESVLNDKRNGSTDVNETISSISTNKTNINENSLNNTISMYVPLFEAGFVQKVIPTSCKDECDFTKAKICKELKCEDSMAWCPVTNDIPNEQIEIIVNITTEIHFMEFQGRSNNETVTKFILQYLKDKAVVSTIVNTDPNPTNLNSITKVYFDPPIRTNYFKIIPISFINSIAMRFELYSKGNLHL